MTPEMLETKCEDLCEGEPPLTVIIIDLQPVTCMKQLGLMILLILLNMGLAQSQVHATNETPIVLVTNIESDGIVGIELLNSFWDKSQNEVLNAYPNAKFYKGLLKGTYERTENLIKPSKGALITMYTNEQIFSSENILPESQLSIGDEVFIGKNKSKIIANQKGELILKVE